MNIQRTYGTTRLLENDVIETATGRKGVQGLVDLAFQGASAIHLAAASVEYELVRAHVPLVSRILRTEPIRSNIPYPGISLWHTTSDGSGHLDLIVVRPEIRPERSLALLEDTEQHLKQHGCRTITSDTFIDPRIMRRLGYAPTSENKATGEHRYEKTI